MAQFQFKEVAVETLEETFAKLVAKPTIDMSPQEIEIRGETVHDISLKILKIETTSMQKLNEAMSARGDEMQDALTNLEKAATENTDYLTMLQAVDQALQLVGPVTDSV